MQLDNVSLALSGVFFLSFLTALFWLYSRSITATVRQQLFDNEKRAFLGQLDIAVHRHLLILPSLPVIDVFETSWLDKLSLTLCAQSYQRFDFTLYHRKNMEIGCVINLIPYRQKQTAKKYRVLRQLCKSADLPLLEYEAKPWRDITELSRTVLSSCGIEDNDGLDFEITAPRETVREVKAIVDPNCPKCKQPMKLKTLTSGPKAGLECWVCTNYPTCNGVRKVHS
ncbi:DUF2726 domain-containing protein [Endozoicomonas ascidiicola]|uniref:DUF2726 domain-containing protein n=1 Tax=Endozoicomonas ascidiicola TaxID=1698521 RepID=UPI000835E3B6|nr:DUF2726 domain-containing protein [Endozoicomonas ascidiicola]